MAERWREWTPPLLIEDVDQGIWLPGGRRLIQPRFTWPPQVIERLRAGYLCINCLEPHEQAWPVNCTLCGFPMRSEQAAYFAKEYGGERELKRRDWDEELDGLEERRRKEDERARQDDQQR